MPSHSRSRSRSPYREPQHHHRTHSRRERSTSHRRHHSHHHHSHKSRRDERKADPPARAASLPFSARHLSRSNDFEAYKGLFASYLDIQKQKFLEDMDEKEVKGRWKSFVGHWNRGELAEGWYDPAMKQKAAEMLDEEPTRQASRGSPEYGEEPQRKEDAHADSDDSEDEFGPAAPLPGQAGRVGPAIPKAGDLQMRDELLREDMALQREDLRFERKTDRRLQKERLEELVPRADPGSRERQMEKKAEKTAAVRGFRDAKSPGAEEVGDGELMGDDGVDAYKKRKKDFERKKTERELRAEEQLRIREYEREERLAEHRAKEEKTMDMLRDLAKKRFG
ncbi:hypothetical protein K490DRAFT_44008 [Saccharata proteae CBS 121410]|uniref:Uncharacterized protein n=1 Tax=Saccharata proteae CBS 121410 TaxID=1314787 RepID=A0A9P4HTT4_9PEZI|nr:hypothetical protein K490DRAFT_44008 [Saccharata proteae CBS 121410]